MRRSVADVPLLAQWLASAALLAAGEDPAPGSVAEKIVCRDEPSKSYALYLPSGYTPEKRWPVLYALDARGRALDPLERFREAAEEFGWILVSSYDTRSDAKDDPNTPAMQAMWNDTYRRLSIDPNRVYATGFSGGGRAAALLASRAPGAIAGVIGCGAGFANDPSSIRQAPPFLYFGTIGDRDFNYYEMRELDEKLAAIKAPHRVEVFDGGHDWPPPWLAREAIAWMELWAMKKGTRERDRGAIDTLYRRDVEGAKALEDGGESAQAYVRYARIAEDFGGLTETADALARAAELGRSAAIRKSLQEALRRDELDRVALRTLHQKLQAALAAPESPLTRVLAAELGIPGLKKKAASAHTADERRSAERILASLRVQTSFYLPEELIRRGDFRRALVALSIAGEIDPDDPRVDYNLAAAHARAGEGSRALRDLQRAVEKGFRSFELLEQDPDFASLRTDPAFQKWIAAARASMSPAPTPSHSSSRIVRPLHLPSFRRLFNAFRTSSILTS